MLYMRKWGQTRAERIRKVQQGQCNRASRKGSEPSVNIMWEVGWQAEGTWSKSFQRGGVTGVRMLNS